jgi:hypothetical protein
MSDVSVGQIWEVKGLFGWRRAKVINESGNQVELRYCDDQGHSSDVGRTFTTDRATMLKYPHLYRPVTDSD